MARWALGSRRPSSGAPEKTSSRSPCSPRVGRPPSSPRGRERHALHGGAPLRAGYDAAPVGAEADEHDVFVAPFLAHELADVHHAAPRHVGVAGIAYVGVVLPDDPLGPGAVVLDQPPQGLGYV